MTKLLLGIQWECVVFHNVRANITTENESEPLLLAFTNINVNIIIDFPLKSNKYLKCKKNHDFVVENIFYVYIKITLTRK